MGQGAYRSSQTDHRRVRAPPRAYAISFKACKTAVNEYGVKRMARYLDASGTGVRQLAKAYVRKALQVTTGWQNYRHQGFRGSAAGVRAAT